MSNPIDYSQGIYDAKKLGTPRMLILGAQHMFAMFGATVLVPLLTERFHHAAVRRPWHAAVPHHLQGQGSRIFGFQLCLPGRLCHCQQ